MNLLFLDTETTGLSPVDSQIIEISALIASFDPVSFDIKIITTFSELVKLRKSLDPKITRITGLDETTLVAAQSVNIIQEKWLNWLENYQIEAVVGHSISFDINFLKNESWYLPETKIIDTVDLSSIILPDAKAVNLEYLITYFDIEIDKYQLDIDTSILKPHRALYDSACAMVLFIILLKKISSLQCNFEVLKTLERNFINLGINFYTNSEFLDYQNEFITEPIKVNLDTTIKNKSIYEKVKFQLNKDDQKLLIEIIKRDWNSSELRSILTYYFVCLHISKNNKEFKIHLREAKDFGFIETIIDFILENSTNKSTSAHFETVEIENIFTQIKSITSTSLNITKLITLTEILFNLINKYSNFETNFINSFISSYDFLLLAISSTSQISSEIEDPILKSKKISFIDQFNSFRQNLDQISISINIEDNLIKNLVNFIISQIDQKLEQIDNLSVNDNFSIFSNQLTVSIEKKDFSIRESFNNLSTTYPQLKFTTYIENWDEINKLLNFYSINLEPEKIIIKDSKFQTIFHQHIDLENTIAELISKSQSKNCPLILCGQNSTLNHIQKIVTNNFSPNQYAVLGESGSLSKIISKLYQNFEGVIVTKFNDYEYIISQNAPKLISEIWIINEPYIYPQPYWNNKNKDDLTKAKKIIRNAFINKIKSKFEKDVNFVNSF
jgi:DNA polymerase III epsilon subunit-like protein